MIGFKKGSLFLLTDNTLSHGFSFVESLFYNILAIRKKSHLIFQSESFYLLLNCVAKFLMLEVFR